MRRETFLIEESGKERCALSFSWRQIASFEKFPHGGLVRQGDAENLKHLVGGSPDSKPLAHNRHETEDGDRHTDLDPHGVLGRPPELLDSEMLLEPLEEELHLPSVRGQLKLPGK